jgi:hypothetical protein
VLAAREQRGRAWGDQVVAGAGHGDGGADVGGEPGARVRQQEAHGVAAWVCKSRAPGGVVAQDNGVQGNGVQGDDVQRMAVSPLGELRPRSGRGAGRSRAVQEELQCGGCKWIRTGVAGPRVEDVGGR